MKSFCDNYCDASDWDDGGSSTDGVDVDTDEDHSLVNVIYDDHDSLINNSSTNWCIFTPFYLNYPQFIISWQMFSRLFLFTDWSKSRFIQPSTTQHIRPMINLQKSTSMDQWIYYIKLIKFQTKINSSSKRAPNWVCCLYFFKWIAKVHILPNLGWVKRTLWWRVTGGKWIKCHVFSFNHVVLISS